MRITAKSLFLLTAVVVLGGGTRELRADTNVSGTISADTTWTVLGSPYIVTGSVSVNSGVTLTIQPGVTVKFNGDQALFVYGTLSAVGMPLTPITFTSSAASPAPGDWRAIDFLAGSSSCQISYASVSYGGAQYNGAIVVEGGSAPSISHVTVDHSSTNGIFVLNGSPSVTASTIGTSGNNGIRVNAGTLTTSGTALTDNGDYAIAVNGNAQLADLSAMSASGNGGGAKNAIARSGGTLSTSTRWIASAALPWEVTGGLSLDFGATLTIDPGTTVRFNADCSLFIYGTLTAVGTALSPITFTSSLATPTPGSWRAIDFISGDNTSEIAYATVSYAGAGWGGAIVVEVASSPTLRHLTVSNSSTNGIYVVNGSPTLRDSTLTANGANGVRIDAGTLTTSGTTITDNTAYAIAVNGNAQIADLSGMSTSGNGSGAKNAIARSGVNLTSATDWRASGALPWEIIGGVSIDGSATLTIEPGATVRFTADQSILVYGTLNAVGTAANPITFTSSLATPTAGSWRAVDILSGTATSQIAYATVAYAGAGWGGAIVVEQGSAPTLTHVTVMNSSTNGIYVWSGSPIIRDSTISASGTNGIQIDSGTLTVSGTTLTNNGQYAISLNGDVQLADVSGMSASGNGGGAKNAIRRSGGTISGATRWIFSSALPWEVVGGVSVDTAATLTIDPGTTVRFGNSTNLVLYGTLTALGTAASPITLTSSAATPTPGIWQGLIFQAGAASSASQLSYVAVSYGGFSNQAAIWIENSSPSFDHVSVNGAAGLAFYVTGANAAPTLVNGSLTANGFGFTSTGPQFSAARLTYWDAANGPGGHGLGSGETVSQFVDYEPWLMAAPSQPQFFASAEVRNRTFNPVIGMSGSVTFTTSLSGTWTMTIRNSLNLVIRTLTGTGASGTATWDGRDTLGVIQPNSAYSYQLDSVAGVGQVATTAKGFFVTDATWLPAITGDSLIPTYFSPNADGVQDTATWASTANDDTTSWVLNIKNGSGTVVRSVTGTGAEFNFVWDGRDGASSPAPNGTYTFETTATFVTGPVTVSHATTLDRTPPTATISSPVENQVLMNLHQNGSGDVSVIATIGDTNLDTWALTFSTAAQPWGRTPIQSGTTAASDTQIGVFRTTFLANGDYLLRLEVADRAGNRSIVVVPVTVANFTVSNQNGRHEFNAAAGQTIVYQSVFPATATETVMIRNEAGDLVRTLFTEPRSAGSYLDSWDGRNDQGFLVPDGAYFCTATFTSGSASMTWNPNNVFVGGGEGVYPIVTSVDDPFDNQAVGLTYTFMQPGRTDIVFTKVHDVTVADCAPPNYCWLSGLYESSGTHTVYWPGTDDSLALRPDLTRVVAVSRRDNFPQNAVMVYGTRLTISSVSVNPPYYGPAAGMQTVSFTLSTYQSQNAAIEVAFKNQNSGSVLRTISQAAQGPGPVSLTWDGRADNGMWVAPGVYIVTVTVTDPLGNRAIGRTLTQVRY